MAEPTIPAEEEEVDTEVEEVEVEYHEVRHRVTPGSFFKLFFTPEIFAELAENTNNYANMKRASLPSTT